MEIASDPRLAVEVGPLRLKNPVVMASGTFGYGLDYPGIVEPGWVGAVVTKGLSLQPWPGHSPPRLVEVAAGAVNAIGLENPGVDEFLDRLLPPLREAGAVVIANVVGRSVEEYVEVARRLASREGVAALELNISCPNVKEGGVQFAASAPAAARVTAAVREVCGLPILVKLAPMAADPVQVARAVAAAGADGVTVANTYPAMVIDVASGRPALSSLVGGLSGPAIRPLTLRLVWEVYRTTRLPIVASGGVMSAADALEYLMAGACAVAVGTATFVRPRTAVEVVEGLWRYVQEQGLESVAALIGSAHRRCSPEAPPGLESVPAGTGVAQQLLQASGAILAGHFRLSSGLHSDGYVEKFRVLERPGMAEEVARQMAAALFRFRPHAVVGPLTGGMLLAYELARQLGAERALFTERVGGRMTLRRGFRLQPGERAVVVEDVVTTGGSLRETAEAVREAGGQVVAMTCVVDRSGGRFAPPVPYYPLVRLDLAAWPEQDCPLCRRGVPLSEPGSRRL